MLVFYNIQKMHRNCKKNFMKQPKTPKKLKKSAK